MKALMILKKTLALFDDADKWVKGYYSAKRVGKGHSRDAATNVKPDGVTYLGKGFNCYCLVGGLRKVAKEDWTPEYRDALGLIQIAIGETDVEDWNDEPKRTVAQVRAALKKAIKLAEAA